MDPLNIAIASSQLYPHGGGTGVYCDRVTRGLSRRGSRVWLISSVPRDAADFLEDGVRYIHVPLRRRTIPFTSLLDWERRVARVLRRIEDQHGLDVVEFPSYQPEGMVYALSRRRAAVSIRVHESRRRVGPGRLWSDPRDSVREVLCGVQMAHADAILPVSDALRENCVAYMGSERHTRKIITVRPGYDLDLFVPTPLPRGAYPALEGKRVILFVGWITEPKGAYNLIEAFRDRIAPRFEDTVLALVGTPDDPDRFRAALSGSEGRVVELGRVPARDLPALYSHAYVLAGPSRNEPFGAVFVEALACGTPVVSVARGGPLEIVEHGETGLLCPDNSPESIARALERLLSDRGLRDRLARSARDSVLRRFDMDRVTTDLMEVYCDIAAERGRTGGARRRSVMLAPRANGFAD